MTLVIIIAKARQLGQTMHLRDETQRQMVLVIMYMVQMVHAQLVAVIGQPQGLVVSGEALVKH